MACSTRGGLVYCGRSPLRLLDDEEEDEVAVALPPLRELELDGLSPLVRRLLRLEGLMMLPLLLLGEPLVEREFEDGV